MSSWKHYQTTSYGSRLPSFSSQESSNIVNGHVLYIVQAGVHSEKPCLDADPGPEYAKLMEAFSSKKLARLPTIMSQTLDAEIKESKSAFYSSPPRENEKLEDFEVVKYGFHFFKIFKGLIVDLISHNDRNESRNFFLGRNPEDALKVLEVELNFIYEVLYTKFFVIHNLIGYLLRSQGLDKFDIRVTYTLLLGALGLEAIALFNLILSDWTTASLDKKPKTNSTESSLFWTIFEKYLNFWSSKLLKCKDGSGKEFSKRVTPVLLRRWSESVAGFNLITYCLKKLLKKSHEENDQLCLGIYKKNDFLDELKYAAKKPLRKDLWEYIFEELRRKSKEADQPENIKKISSARGAYVLEEYCKEKLGGEVVLLETLKTEYIENFTFDESLLLWHIATELCFHGNEVNHNTKAQPNEELSNHGSEVDHKFISKLVSDYMLYLLVMKPTMMFAAKRFFHNKGLGPNNNEKEACENLLAVNIDVKPAHVKGDRSKFVLFDACMLAKELQKFEKKWEVISKVWVEMLSYASNHCRPDAHAQQVSRGGQLINLVWLLMAHFGLVEQFVFTAGFVPAKLTVEK
ncbi:hypothetical protein I3843_15G049100 [Carya illinoinensis]|nr:hypothetical protein I3843_15G049100 [Carya illinoinensis]